MNEIRKLYQNKGYQFLAITDHRLYYNQNDKTDFLLLNGCEYNCYLDLEGYSERIHFHLLTLQDPSVINSNPIPHDGNTYKSLFYKSLEDVEKLINELKTRGNIVIVAHPKNLMIPLELLTQLKGYDGIEVYNEKAKSDATDYINSLYETHENLLLTASDDAHQYLDANGEPAYFKGFIVVEDCDVTKTNVMKAIKSKRFYASNGPIIKVINVETDSVMINTSEVQCILFVLYADDSTVKVIKKSEDQTMTKAIINIPDGTKAIRIECTALHKKKNMDQYYKTKVVKP